MPRNDLDGVNWTAANYDDSAWTGSGPGLLWTDVRGPNPDIPLLDTEMPLDPDTGYPFITYDFRTHFHYTNALAGVSLVLTTYIDDGAVFYLNGAELYRLRMPAVSRRDFQFHARLGLPLQRRRHLSRSVCALGRPRHQSRFG